MVEKLAERTVVVRANLAVRGGRLRVICAATLVQMTTAAARTGRILLAQGMTMQAKKLGAMQRRAQVQEENQVDQQKRSV